MKLWNGKLNGVQFAKAFIKEAVRGVAIFAGAWIVMGALEKLCGIPFKWSVVAAIWVLYYLLRYSIGGE